MMKTRSVLVVVCLVVFATVALAQTASQKLAWEQPAIGTVVAAQALKYTATIDTAPPVPLVQTCTLAATVVSCTAPIATLSSGPHTVTLVTDNGFAMAATTIGGSLPSAPVNVKIVMTFTIP